MTIDRILPFTRRLLSACVAKGDLVVDGTCGNGHDTLFLAELVGETGHVYAFDIQPAAITATDLKLKASSITHVNLILASHEYAYAHLPPKLPLAAAIYNLGYLPGTYSDKTITTQGHTTWESLTQLLPRLKVGGVILLVVYHGHPEGKNERDFLENAIVTLDAGQYSVLRYAFVNKTDAPYVLAIEKLKAMPLTNQTLAP